MDRLRLSQNDRVNKYRNRRGFGQEQIIYSNNVTKINRKGKGQTRTLMITDTAVYNLLSTNLGKCKRRIKLEDIGALTVSRTTEEFVIHVPNEYDYRISSKEKEDIAKLIKTAFKKRVPRGLLPIQRTEKRQLVEEVVTRPMANKLSMTQRASRKNLLANCVSLTSDEEGDTSPSTAVVDTPPAVPEEEIVVAPQPVEDVVEAEPLEVPLEDVFPVGRYDPMDSVFLGPPPVKQKEMLSFEELAERFY